jgi:predicted transport protein
MAENSVSKKLQIKPGTQVATFHAPDLLDAALSPLPDGAALRPTPAGQFPMVMLFAGSQSELRERIPTASAAMAPGGVIWICFPKTSAKTGSDLNRDTTWKVLEPMGFEPHMNVAIDEVWSALRFRVAAPKTDDDPVDVHFAGPKAVLRPLYDQLAAHITGLGDDVVVGARASYISFGRPVQFANLRAATKDRLEVSLKLTDPADDPRLVPLPQAAGATMTHKVSLAPTDPIFPELLTWLSQAYDRQGKKK